MTRLRRAAGHSARFICAFILLSFVTVSPAIAQSAGCLALNNQTFSTASFTAQAYPASQFEATDTLTLTFTDYGTGSTSNTVDTDSFGKTNDAQSVYMSYYANNGSAGTHTYTYTGSQLSTEGIRFRLTSSHGYLSPVTASCTSAASVSTDATLSALSLSAGSLSPTFSSGTTSYNASVANSVTSITLTPVTTDSTATVKVNGTSVISGSASGAIPLSEGSNTLTVTVTAADGTTTSGYSVQVQRNGLAPVAGSTSASVAFNSSNNTITLPLSGGATTLVAQGSAPAHGSVVFSGSAALYTPQQNYFGADSFTYTAGNNWGTSAPATVTVNIAAPVISLSPVTLPSATSGTPYSQTLTATGGSGSYQFTTADALPAGLALAVNGEISGTPTATGSFNITVVAQDTANAATGSQRYTLAVTGQAPVAGAVSTTVAGNSSINAIVPALSGGVAASVTVTTAPLHGTATASGTSLSYTPAPGFSGADSFTYIASNNWGSSAPATVNVNVASVTLGFSPAGGALPAATSGLPWSQTITASSGTAPYTYSASGLPSGLSVSASTGEISGTPAASGSYAIQVSAADSNGITGTVNYQLTVAGQAPVVSAVSSTVAANTTENLIEPVLSGGAVTSLAIVQQPAHGTARIQNLKIRYTPVAGYSGSDSFIYSAANNFGSAQARVTLNVTTATLSVTPASGTLPEGREGTAYRQTFSATGGTAPYQFGIAGALPAGLTLSGDTLSGTPSAAGHSSFTLTATDASGVTTQVAYSLNMTRAQPVGVSHTASVLAGKSVRVNLTENATGGPFTAARLLDSPEKTLGSATLEQSGNGVYLDFQATAQASGTVALRYVLLTAGSQSAPATVMLTITGRPDPSKDPDVLGLVSAQVQSAQNFARAQIRNFSDRLETLHNPASTQSDMNGIRFNMPTSKKERSPDDTLWNAAWKNTRPLPELPQLTDKTSAQTTLNRGNSRINYWTGGFVDFGHSGKDGVSFSHTLVGISTGADYQFTPTFTAGMGMGFGRDVSDIGDNGSRSNGRSLSSALYGSYHPGSFFIDGLLGYSRLDYDSRRYVTEMDHFARGDRGGNQVFGAVTSGYDYRLPALLVSPYGRLQLSRTRLDSYTESNAGGYDLAYASQTLNDVTGALGVRTQYALPLTWSTLRWQSRVEYTQAFSDRGRARLGYADAGNDSFSADVYGDSQENLVFGLGLDFLLPHDMTPGIAYQGTLGLDEERSRSQMIMLRMNIGF
ncbi:hypothetical protein A9993_23110 [Rahnella victoriana]|uniref:autotransporter domain-containing protein n=1 Tax=Rahnella victoriana TaxID=1510570 RepID=UPI000BB1BB72|nr:autotransporter domain-containing protein [Rahnella victoriana]PBI77762.1 hypothetical protein A9993_23110 [Rahnella victoriana]